MGMSGLAQVYAREGIIVTGSDRNYGLHKDLELFLKLERLGIKIYPQNGSGIDSATTKVVMSKAIEDDNPDLIKARRLGKEVTYRQEELKKIFSKKSLIAIAGTCGKTTVVGMIGSIFKVSGHDISIVNGGIMTDYAGKNTIGNVHLGESPYCCIETDESEGDLKGYVPEIGVLTNIGNDHFSYNRLEDIYKEFIRETKKMVVINVDSFNIEIKDKNVISYSIDKDSDLKAEEIELYPHYSLFQVNGYKIRLNVPGLHNIYNALAAIGASLAYGISIKIIVKGLEKFSGIKQRFEIFNRDNGIRIIVDYAHNPDKIAAALQAAQLFGERVIVVYQPHGYGPTKLFLKELTDVFSERLREKDFLFVPDIYYAGGSVEKNISSEVLVNEIKKSKSESQIQFVPERQNISKAIKRMAARGDAVLVMGGRDVTLYEWAKTIL